MKPKPTQAKRRKPVTPASFKQAMKEFEAYEKRRKQSVIAWAWLCDFGLCKWAEPDFGRLVAQRKPSPEAKAVRVRMTVI